MSEGEKVMKATKILVIGHWILVIGLLLMSRTAQATAPTYQNTYKPVNHQAVYVMPTTATAPTATFQSTSVYSAQWNQDAQQSMLNADGSVNSGAYMGAPTRKSPALRKTEINNPGDPDEEEDDGNAPLGDGLLALLAMAVGYAVYRKTRMLGAEGS